MPADFLLAPAAAGKTAYAIARIHALRRSEPLAAIWVILPNNAQVVAFRRRLVGYLQPAPRSITDPARQESASTPAAGPQAAEGSAQAMSGAARQERGPSQSNQSGALGVRLGTFYALYGELLAEAGTLVACLDEPVLYRLLRAVAAELHARGELEFFARVRDKPGFIRALHAAIQELKRARIEPAHFVAQVQGREARLGELARIYAGYQERLLASDWVDDEGRGWLAARALERDPTLSRPWRLLVVDGFDEFNPTQLEVVRLLASRVHETLITLTGAERERLAYRRFSRARRQLESALDLRRLPDISISPAAAATAFARLESALFEPAPIRPESPELTVVGDVERNQMPTRTDTDLPEFVRAPTRTIETRAALRWLKARIVRDGCAPREVALLARVIEPYRALIEETAAEFGMPLRFAEGASLITNPALAALLDLLALPLEDFPHRAVVDAWRSPYFNWSAQRIAPGDAERMDAAARWGQVSVGKAQWQDTLSRLAQAVPADAAADAERDDDSAPLVAPTAAAADALKRKFESFCARLDTPAQPATLRDFAAWVEELIGSDPALQTPGESDGDGLQIVARAREAPATAARDVAALRGFKDVLRALALGQAVQATEKRPIAYADFWAELRGAVEAATYHTPPPGDRDYVVVSSVLGARGLSFRAVALIGMAEGEFPRAASEDPLLTEADRTALGLTSRLSGDEVTVFYEAVTRARERLLFTRPYLADDGQPWEPSPYWEHVLSLTGRHEPNARTEEAVPLHESASVTEWVASAASAPFPLNNLPPRAGAEDWMAVVPPRLRATGRGAQVLAARLSAEAHGPYEGDLSSLQARLAADFPPSRSWSASRLETYGACGFNFFASYALGLEPRPTSQAGYDARQFGTMLHAILERLFRDAADAADAEALLAGLPAVARVVFDHAPAEYGFRPTALWTQQRRELEHLLAETVRELAAVSAGWKPIHFELAFGNGQMPPLVLGGHGIEIRLRGYIDRVDQDASGALRVIDYKTGSTPIRDKDLDEGVRLQLPLYALAVRDAASRGAVTSGFYWHVGSARPSSLQLETYPDGVEAAFDVAAGHALAHASRALAGDFAPRPPEGGCPPWCPATAFCWRYQPKRF